MTVAFGSGITVITSFWTSFKATVIQKGLAMQYADDGVITTVFAFDGAALAYNAVMYDGGNVPDGLQSSYSVAQNNSDLSDFQTNYQANCNKPVVGSAIQSLFANSTITAGGSSILGGFAGFGTGQVSLVINVKNAPTGTTPGLQFTLAEVDPVDGTTVIGSSVTGSSITALGTQTISLFLTVGGTIKVSWIVVGSASPTFTGVNVTLISKASDVATGVDLNGTERLYLVDTSGRQIVVGPAAVGAAGTGNPVLMGGIDPAGTAQYSLLSTSRALFSAIDSNTQPILANATVTSSTGTVVAGFGCSLISVFVNIKNAPTGTNPTITFTLQEVDPGDRATSLGTSIVGTPLTTAGTQILTLPLTTSGVVSVTWTIGGTSPSFSGVYVTASSKAAQASMGPSAVGTTMTSNPVVIGATDNLNTVQSVDSRLVNGFMSLCVIDRDVLDKLDEVLLALYEIRDRLKQEGD